MDYSKFDTKYCTVRKSEVKDVIIKDKLLSEYLGTKDFGYGVFAKSDIPKDSIIEEYKGEAWIENDWDKERFSSVDKRASEWTYAMMAFDGILISKNRKIHILIDGYDLSRGNITRFINGFVSQFPFNSDETENINVEMLPGKIIDDRETRSTSGILHCRYKIPTIITTRDIKKDEELILDYGDNYWKSFFGLTIDSDDE